MLTPEVTLLRLHAHAHTTEPELAPKTLSAESRQVLSLPHRHCHAEQLYDVPFTLIEPVPVPQAVAPLIYSSYQTQPVAARALHLLDGACLRGPPLAAAVSAGRRG